MIKNKKNENYIKPARNKNSDIIDAVQNINLNLQNNLQEMSMNIVKAIKEALSDNSKKTNSEKINNEDHYDYDNLELSYMESEDDQIKWDTKIHEECRNNFDQIYEKYQSMNNDISKLFNDRQELEERLFRMKENTTYIYNKLKTLQNDRIENNKNQAQDILLRKTVENYENNLKLSKSKSDTNDINDTNLNYSKAVKNTIPTKTIIYNENLEEEEYVENEYLDRAKFNHFTQISNNEQIPLPKGIVKKAQDYISEKKIVCKVVKNSEKIISQDTHDKRRDELIKRIKTTIVIRGIDKEVFNAIENRLIQQKKISKIDDNKTKETIVTKSYIGHIFKTKLKIDNDTFGQIKYKEIFRNENNDVIVQFEDQSNVGYIYHMTKNLDKMDKISFTEYIPAEFYRRHREINSFAKILRNNDWKTHVRMGKFDYKLLAKK